jgi:hypothetical protein
VTADGVESLLLLPAQVGGVWCGCGMCRCAG